jgi:uncharacterized membrane protein YphA (DoxX/SURF4 family)
MKQKITAFIDCVLVFTVTAFFSLAVAVYFLSGNLTAAVAAALAFATCATAFTAIAQRKRRRYRDTETDRVMNQFIYREESFAYRFVRLALQKRYAVESKRTWLKVNKTAVFVRLKPGVLSANDLIGAYSKARGKAEKLLILSVDGPCREARELSNALPDFSTVDVLDRDQVYGLLKWLGSLPKIEIVLKRNPHGLRNFLNGCIAPRNAKGYFATALLLAGSSFIMAYSAYYIAAAAVCMALGLASKARLAERITERLKKS